MPSFIGIGAQKAGTTWLSMILRRHPGIFLSEEKELHFWNLRRDRGLDWYEAQFAGAAPGQATGEITPAYSMLEEAQIREVQAAFPDVRLVFLMRNPVERAWSSALMALGRAEMTFPEASDAWFIDHFRSTGSTLRGDYERTIRNWRAVFPADRLLLLTFDEIVGDPRALLGRCAGHLGVDPTGFDPVPDSHLRTAVFEGPKHALRPALKDWLVAHYAPKIRSLEAYLGLDLSAWHAANAEGRRGPLARLLARLT